MFLFPIRKKKKEKKNWFMYNPNGNKHFGYTSQAP